MMEGCLVLSVVAKHLGKGFTGRANFNEIDASWRVILYSAV